MFEKIKRTIKKFNLKYVCLSIMNHHFEVKSGYTIICLWRHTKVLRNNKKAKLAQINNCLRKTEINVFVRRKQYQNKDPPSLNP